MSRHDEASSGIREALDREAARRFDAERFSHPSNSTSSGGTLSPDIARHDRREGPFGRLPVSVQWVGLAAALLGAILGIRSLWLERARGESIAESPAVTSPLTPPGADVSHPVAGETSAPPLSAERAEPAAEPKPRAPEAADGGNTLLAASTPPVDPLAAEPDRRARDDSQKSSGSTVAVVATATGTGPVGSTENQGTGSRLAAAPLPSIVSGPAASEAASGPGVQVLSARIGGQRVRPRVREVPEVGATLVLLPAIANLSAYRGESRPHTTIAAATPAIGRSARSRHRRSGGTMVAQNAAPIGQMTDEEMRAWIKARADAAREALARGDETPTDSSSGEIDATKPAAGAYYVRMLLGSRFDPMPERSQGLMGSDIHVVPLRENEVWGDAEQERFLTTTFDLSSVVAVDGARIEPESGEERVESTFVVGVAGHLFDVSLQGAPGEAEGFHRIELLVRRADGKKGETGDGLSVLNATLVVENGRVIVLGIPEPDDAVHAKRGPRVVFLALSPRFDTFAEQRDREPIHTVHGEIDPPVLVEKTQPEYSAEAIARGAEGKVVLQAVIRKDGTVGGVQVIRVPEDGDGEFLVESAARAVRQWRYLPAQLHGEPVNVYFTVVVQFTLVKDDGA